MPGTRPDFLPETAHIRAGDWVAAPIPADLQDRRVSTGPVDRKMVILELGRKVFMADFEDANFANLGEQHQGRHQLRDAINRTTSNYQPRG